MQMLILPDRQLFICDTHVNVDPDAEQIAAMTLMAAEQVQRFGADAQRRAGVPFQLRQLARAVGAEDARGGGAARDARAGTVGGGRDARGFGAVDGRSASASSPIRA